MRSSEDFVVERIGDAFLTLRVADVPVSEFEVRSVMGYEVRDVERADSSWSSARPSSCQTNTRAIRIVGLRIPVSENGKQTRDDVHRSFTSPARDPATPSVPQGVSLKDGQDLRAILGDGAAPSPTSPGWPEQEVRSVGRVRWGRSRCGAYVPAVRSENARSRCGRDRCHPRAVWP